MRSHLQLILSTLPHDDSPLTLDLRGVTLLSQECLRLLLWVRGDHARTQQIIFHLSATGLPRQMIQQLGLEEKLGLEDAHRLIHAIKLKVKSRDVATKKKWPAKGAINHG